MKWRNFVHLLQCYAAS